MKRHELSILFQLFLGACFTGLFLSSCEKTLTASIDDFEAQIVVNTQFSNDPLWHVRITQSEHVLNPLDDNTLCNAQVVITDNLTGVVFNLEHESDGVYVGGSRKPKRDRFYSLKVIAEGFNTATALGYVPAKVKNVESSYHDIDELDGSVSRQFQIEIEDDPTEENFYVWEIDRKFDAENENAPSIIDELISADGSDGNLASTPDIPKNFGSPGFLDDSSFSDNNKYNAVFKTSKSQPNDGGNNTPSYKEVYNLKVTSVTKDLYNYLKSLDDYSKSNQVNSSESNPGQIYTNIDNGLGIFGGYSQQIIEL